MPTPDQLAVHLSRAYGLTEIFPLRHSNVQDALKGFVDACRETGLEIELRGEDLWADGTRVDDESGDVADLARSLARCGVARIGLAGNLAPRAIGSFLDTLRIASISGRLDSLKELATFYAPGLAVEFGDAPEVAELAEPAGAIFASAIAGADAGAAGTGPTPSDPPATPDAPSVSEGTVASDGGSVEESAPDPSVPATSMDESDEVVVDDPSAWDPPGAEPMEAQAVGLHPTDFLVGARLFMSGEPAQRRGWLGPLSDQAGRVAVDDDPDTVADAVTLLLEPEGDVLQEIVDIASQLTTDTVAQVLATRLRLAKGMDDPDALLRVMAALGEKAAPAVGAEIAECLDRASRLALVHALGFLGEHALPTVGSMLEDPRWYVVRNALTVLTRIGDDRQLDAVGTALDHADGRVRREAVMALVRVGGSELPALLDRALGDPDADVRAVAAMVIGNRGLSELTESLRAQLDVEETEDAVVEVIRALGVLRDEEAVPVIGKRARVSFFSRASRAIRVAAYRALGRIGTPEAVAVVEEGAEDKDPEVRTAARQVLEGLD